MAEKFTGFANAPVDKKGKALDFRTVKPFEDESEEGKVRTESQTSVSTVVTGKPGRDDASEGDTTTAQAAGGKEASGS